MGRVQLFYNCRILRNHELKKDNLWVRNGKIIDPKQVDFVSDIAYDCGGAILAPGFIDLKMNGGFGVDFSNLSGQMRSLGEVGEGKSSSESPNPYASSQLSTNFANYKRTVTSSSNLSDPNTSGCGSDLDFDDDGVQGPATHLVDKVAKLLPATGVTAFCPTIISSAPEVYKSVLPQIKARPGSASKGARIIGVHLDGPFLDKNRAGAHPKENIRDLSDGLASLEEVYGSGDNLENVSIVTLAPELPNALDIVRALKRWNIAVALGHSSSTLNQGIAAVEAGASLLTHLFNAMPTFHHRDPSLVGLLATDLPAPNSKIYFGIIADGNHTHPAALRMAYKIAPESLLLVSDGVAPLGLGKGTYTLGDTVVVVEQEQPDSSPRCTVQGTTTLSGSIAPLDVCVRNLVKYTNCSLAYALESASLRPATALGIADKMGTLNFGANADLVVLEPNSLKVLATFIEGRVAFRSNNDVVLPKKSSQTPFC